MLPQSSEAGVQCFSGDNLSDAAPLSIEDMKVADLLLRLENCDDSSDDSCDEDASDFDDELFCYQVKHGNSFVCSLAKLTAAEYSSGISARREAACMLQDLLPTMWPRLDTATKESAKKLLLLSLSGNFPEASRYPVLMALTIVARLVCCGEERGTGFVGSEQQHQQRFHDLEGWPEFSEKLFAFMASEVCHERRNAVQVVGMVCRETTNPRVFDVRSVAVMEGLLNGLQDSSLCMRMTAAFTTVKLYCAVGLSILFPVQEHGGPLILNLLRELVSEGQDEKAESVLHLFAEKGTWFWEQMLADFGSLVFEITSLPLVDCRNSKRRLSLVGFELLGKLFEQQEGRFFDQCLPLLEPFVGLCLTTMAVAADPDQSQAGKLSIRRLGSALGGVMRMNELVSEYIGPFLYHETSWQHRRAGIWAISEYTRGSLPVFNLEGTFPLFRHVGVHDPHPAVRDEANLALSQLRGGLT